MFNICILKREQKEKMLIKFPQADKHSNKVRYTFKIYTDQNSNH